MAHQAKRPYAGSQPSITSYFSAATNNHNHNYSISSHQFASSAVSEGTFPAPPPSVQSNLLNVGMRVRKSVPEGYKTNSFAYSPFFVEDRDIQTVPTSTLAPALGQRILPVAKTRPRAGVRELTPFCGILKVGGMAQQADDEGGIYSDEEMEDDEEVPWLAFGSQESVMSSVGKRRFSDEEEEVALAASFGGTAVGERVLAVPRRRGGGKKAGRGQENVAVLGEDDFQEAEFLDYGLVGEVEMSG